MDLAAMAVRANFRALVAAFLEAEVGEDRRDNQISD